MNKVEFFLWVKDAEIGPVGLAEIEMMIQKGELSEHFLLRPREYSQFQPLEDWIFVNENGSLQLTRLGTNYFTPIHDPIWASQTAESIIGNFNSADYLAQCRSRSNYRTIRGLVEAIFKIAIFVNVLVSLFLIGLFLVNPPPGYPWFLGIIVVIPCAIVSGLIALALREALVVLFDIADVAVDVGLRSKK